MSAAIPFSVADPSVAGGAVPAGRRLLGLVQRMMGTGMAMARHINRIARQRLEGQALTRLAPAGFNPTFTNALVVEAVAYTAALRERLLALVGRPAFAPGCLKAERAPQARGGTVYSAAETAESAADDCDWRDLAKPLRVGPGGVAVAARLIAGLSDRDVVTHICGNLSRAAAQLGAEADIARIAALAAAARALCPEAVAEAGDGGAAAGGADGAPAAGRPSDKSEEGAPEVVPEGAENGPPPRPPD